MPSSALRSLCALAWLLTAATATAQSPPFERLAFAFQPPEQPGHEWRVQIAADGSASLDVRQETSSRVGAVRYRARLSPAQLANVVQAYQAHTPLKRPAFVMGNPPRFALRVKHNTGSVYRTAAPLDTALLSAKARASLEPLVQALLRVAAEVRNDGHPRPLRWTPADFPAANDLARMIRDVTFGVSKKKRKFRCGNALRSWRNQVKRSISAKTRAERQLADVDGLVGSLD